MTLPLRGEIPRDGSPVLNIPIFMKGRAMNQYSRLAANRLTGLCLTWSLAMCLCALPRQAAAVEVGISHDNLGAYGNS